MPQSPTYSPTNNPDALRFKNEDELIDHVGNHFSLIMPEVMKKFAATIAADKAGRAVVKQMWNVTPASVLRKLVTRFVHKNTEEVAFMESVAMKVPDAAFVQLIEERAPANRQFFADVPRDVHDHLAYDEADKEVYTISDLKKRKIVGAQMGRLTLESAYGSGGVPDDKYHRKVIYKGQPCVFSTADFGFSKYTMKFKLRTAKCTPMRRSKYMMTMMISALT